jgi:low affinity Fe/Cu permease
MPALAPGLLVHIGRRLHMRAAFRVFASRTAEWVGTPAAFVLGLGLVVLWALTGPLFGYSDTWQLVVNTATTIVTFLMVFLIQNTQNRDARAIHLKLDELIRGVKGARTAMVALENATDEELAELQEEFDRLHRRLAGGRPGSASPVPADDEPRDRQRACRHGAGESVEQ